MFHHSSVQIFSSAPFSQKLLHLKIAIFLDIAPCNPDMNGRLGGTYRLHLQGQESAEQETGVRAGGQAE
jgi:hypothetical protein